MKQRTSIACAVLLTAIVMSSTGAFAQRPTLSSHPDGKTDDYLDQLAQHTWTYLSSDWATDNHLPWSSRMEHSILGSHANPAEIGLYALSWLAAYDLQRPWSPSWAQTETEISAVLDQLRAWQTGTQAEQPHGPNAYEDSVFYQAYWITQEPPVVGDGEAHDTNHTVPSIDNAWLALSLITTREYAEANGYSTLADKANDILGDMDFTMWYDPATHLFFLGAAEKPRGGKIADYYSNENRIINFVAHALGQLSTGEYHLSLKALKQPSRTYHSIIVDKVAWDGSYFTYSAPALFIREMATPYGDQTITPATHAQMAYADDQGYRAWGLSDCFDVHGGEYGQQGALPVAEDAQPEERPGLVAPHASALALITPFASDAITNLQTISDTFACAYDPRYGFRDSVMANPISPDYGECSWRFSALAQEWVFLAIANHETGFIWQYFYRDPGVVSAHVEMFGAHRLFLPSVMKESVGRR